MYRPAGPPDGGTPGITSCVDGGAVLGSQLAVPPWDELSETSAATRPMLVRTSIATTLAFPARDDRASVTVWCGGTVIPVSPSAWTWPASVMMLTSTLAGKVSMFIRSSWICAAPPCWPGPTNHRSEPGSPQRTLARPVPVVSSASMVWAMVPVAVTDQPCSTVVAFLLVLCAAGVVSIDSRPGWVWLIGFRVRSCAPASGNGASSAWPSPGRDDDAAGDPAMKATLPDPPPWTGGQARAAEVTATCCGAMAAWPGPGAAGAAGPASCAAAAMPPSASSTTPAGTRWIGLTAGHRIPTEHAGPRSSDRGSPRARGLRRRPGRSPWSAADGHRTARARAVWPVPASDARASRAARRAGRRGVA